jgi:phage major head subunit gpT-like protein
MQVTTAALDAIRVGFRTDFMEALGQAEAMSKDFATEIPSTTKEERMGWLNKIPGVREWVGDRQLNNLSEADYTIKNKSWEDTIKVDRDHIEDDNLGVYKPQIAELGDAAAAHREQLIFGAYKNGFTTNCFNGQPYFSTSHPVLDANGSVTTFANTDGGAGAPWFLICNRKRLKPVVWTNRRPWQFSSLDGVTDQNVFMRKEFLYGIDARYNAGYSFPQFAWGSKQTLSATTYELARNSISSMKSDYGRPLGLVPDTLLMPPSLEGGARDILVSATGNAGATNKWRDSAKLVVCPWLA